MKKTKTPNINGMDCHGCESSLRMLLDTIDGVESVKVSYKEKKANIE